MSGDIDMVALNAALAEEEVDLINHVEDVDGGRKRLRLEYPLSETARETGQPQFEDKSITHLNFRRPVAKDLTIVEKMEQSGAQLTGVHLLAVALTGVPVSTLEQLDVDDFQRVQQVIKDFLDRKRLLVKSPTDETPSST